MSRSQQLSSSSPAQSSSHLPARDTSSTPPLPTTRLLSPPGEPSSSKWYHSIQENSSNTMAFKNWLFVPDDQAEGSTKAAAAGVTHSGHQLDKSGSDQDSVGAHNKADNNSGECGAVRLVLLDIPCADPELFPQTSIPRRLASKKSMPIMVTQERSESKPSTVSGSDGHLHTGPCSSLSTHFAVPSHSKGPPSATTNHTSLLTTQTMQPCSVSSLRRRASSMPSRNHSSPRFATFLPVTWPTSLPSSSSC